MKKKMKQMVQFSMTAALLSVAITTGSAFAGGLADNTMFTSDALDYIRDRQAGKTYQAEKPVKKAATDRTISNTGLSDAQREVMRAGKMDVPETTVEKKSVAKQRTVPNTMFTTGDQEYISGSQGGVNVDALTESAPTAIGE